MDIFNAGGAESVFAFVNQKSYQLESLANSALQSGIDRYMDKDFEGAVKEFKRAIGLAPDAPYSVDAAHYMAQAHLQLDEPEKAVKAYHESIRLNPYRDDSHNKLGNLYFSLGRHDDASTQYEKAARLNPDAANIYTLGQAYLNTDRFNEAETQFHRVAQIARQDPAGKYGLGLTFSRQGRYEEAIALFEEAISLKDDFYDAYAEMGYTYADMGEMASAQELVDFLEFEDQVVLADNLSRYMYKVDPPKMVYAQSASTFPFSVGNNTPVQLLHKHLSLLFNGYIAPIELRWKRPRRKKKVSSRSSRISRTQTSKQRTSYPSSSYSSSCLCSSSRLSRDSRSPSVSGTIPRLLNRATRWA